MSIFLLPPAAASGSCLPFELSYRLTSFCSLSPTGPLVDKATGTPLNCGNVGPGDFGMTDCSITEVWQADRKTQKWEQIPALDAFALKSQSSLLHLMVDMVVLRPFAFTALGKARRQLLVDDGEEEDGDKDKVSDDGAWILHFNTSSWLM